MLPVRPGAITDRWRSKTGASAPARAYPGLPGRPGSVKSRPPQPFATLPPAGRHPARPAFLKGDTTMSKRDTIMQALLQCSRKIDWLSSQIGKYVIWLILASVVISGVNAVVRKVLSTSPNAFLEVQWYLFSASFLLAAGYTLLQGEHVKVDVIASRLSRRTQIWIDI